MPRPWRFTWIYLFTRVLYQVEMRSWREQHSSPPAISEQNLRFTGLPSGFTARQVPGSTGADRLYHVSTAML